MKHKHIWVTFKAKWISARDKLRTGYTYELAGIYFRCEKCGAEDLVKYREPRVAYVKQGGRK